MPSDSSVSLTKSREKRSCISEVSEAEKKLWARIHANGVLDKDVKDLYHKACCIYEKLFLSNYELPDLQNIEYLLWRLHYKHIDEFRKTISQGSAKVEDNLVTDQKTAASMMNTATVYMEGFRLFLSEATKFYQDLIRKIKGYYCLLDEPWFYKNDGVCGRIELKRLHKCQFVCHRLCICLGDLARYLELYKKANIPQRNWSVATSYYLEAAKIYPDGGNPQNQLAVLATYIGDEFLALYHCIRSLAVKEPFPDALQNLVLLFERNRSTNIVSLSNEVYDLCKPSDWISRPKNASTYETSRILEVAERDASASTDLWTLFIRMTSFFFLESNFDSFTCTLTSTLRELEAILALDVAKLSSALQSYKNMNLSKAGPYRALHITSVLVFIIHNLNEDIQQKIVKPAHETQQSMLVKLALTVTFTFMGRFVDRCLKGSPVLYFPLLPALLVFVEWLVGAVDKLVAEDEKCEEAMRYFFGSFVKLLNHLQGNRAQLTSHGNVALWEDYELRGFLPLSHTHESLDFSSHWEEEINYKMKNEYRAHRIVQAAIKIAKRSSVNSRNWLFYTEAGRKFSAVEAKESMVSEERKSCPDPKVKEPYQQIDSRKPAAVDEEEDIVFKPIERHNSEPINMKNQPIIEASDECLRRASSVLAAQNRALINSLTSASAIPSGSPSKQLGQDEHKLKGSIPSTVSEVPIAAGPPSLSSWVLNGENLSSGKAKSSHTDGSVLTPIEEMPSGDLTSLSLTTDNSGIASPMTCPSSCCPPSPSDPLLPKNEVWFIGKSDGMCLQNATPREPLNFVGTSYHSDIHQEGLNAPSLMVHSSPFLANIDSQPWNSPQFPMFGNHNLQWANNHATHDQYCGPRNHNIAYDSGAPGFELVDHWGYHDPLSSLPTMYFEGTPPLFHPSPSLLHGLHDQRRGTRIHDYQKPHPWVSPAESDTRPEPQPLLQYLKQREWQLQQESRFTGSPYMQN